jgi:hypothetical protein
MNEFQHILDHIALMKQNQTDKKPFDIKDFNRLESMIAEPRWLLFYGYNTIQIPAFEMKKGGGVSFRDHLDKQLSDILWEDLILRLQASQICIFKPNNTIPCVAMGGKCVYIFLDKHGYVKDIHFAP